jgi:hypothetical protein
VQVGGVRVGSGADRDVTIVNTGNAPAPLGQAQIAGDHWNDFHIVDDKCSNRSLAERECRIRISFIPTEAGTHQAVVVVPYNGGRARETAWIGGSASPPPVPVAAVQPARVELTRRDFEHSVELRNIGDGRLTVTDIAVGGKNPEDFEVDRRDCLHWALPSGGSCVMAVTFQADMAKRQRHKVSEATLMVQDNAAGGPQTVVLIGREGSTDHKKIILEIIGGVAAVIGAYEATQGHGSESGTPTNRPTLVPTSPVTPSRGPIQ